MDRLVLVLPLLVACGAAPAAREPEPPHPGYLLLVPEGEGLRTAWVDENGALRGRADGPLLGMADRLYRFESRPETFALRPCETSLGGVTTDDPDATGTVASAVLVGIGGAASLVLVPSPGDEGLEEHAHHAMHHRVLAAHGRRLVLLTERVWNACGAHDDREVSIATLDLATGAPLEAVAAPTVLAARTDEALTAMRAVDPNRTGECLPPSGLTTRWVTTVPAIREGHVIARHLFATGPVAYACGQLLDAPSSSYEWAIWLDGEASELFEWGPEDAVPAPVLARASAEGAIGLTWLDAERAPLADAFALATE